VARHELSTFIPTISGLSLCQESVDLSQALSAAIQSNTLDATSCSTFECKVDFNSAIEMLIFSERSLICIGRVFICRDVTTVATPEHATATLPPRTP
jgi:hypothetical protein